MSECRYNCRRNDLKRIKCTISRILDMMNLETYVSESEEKDVNECMFAGKMCLIDCGVENCTLMVLILLMKNVAKSSTVRVDE